MQSKKFFWLSSTTLRLIRPIGGVRGSLRASKCAPLAVMHLKASLIVSPLEIAELKIRITTNSKSTRLKLKWSIMKYWSRKIIL